MDQTVTLETFENYLLNAVQSHNQAMRMQGSTAHFSVLGESGVMGDPQSEILIWTDPDSSTEGYSTYYKVNELFELYSGLDKEGQRGFFSEALEAVSSGSAMSALEDMLDQKQKKLADKEYLLANVYPAVIQAEGNEEHLAEMPNRGAGETELRIYYYVDVPCTFGKNNEVVHSHVNLTNDMLERANQGRGRKLTEEALYRAARANISGYTKVEGCWERIVREICAQNGITPEEGKIHPPNIESYYYISAPDLPCGAAAAFLLCGVDQIEEKWGNAPAYFIPLSKNEVCVRIVNGAPPITKIVNEQERRNMDQPLRDQLSNSIYYYEPKKKRLTIECQGNPVYLGPEKEREHAMEIPAGAYLRGGR